LRFGNFHESPIGNVLSPVRVRGQWILLVFQFKGRGFNNFQQKLVIIEYFLVPNPTKFPKCPIDLLLSRCFSFGVQFVDKIFSYLIDLAFKVILCFFLLLQREKTLL
jgi:hypothetical protein